MTDKLTRYAHSVTLCQFHARLTLPFRIAIINGDKVRHTARSPANPAVADF